MIDWEKLNAYADRELDDAAAAEVAAAAARDPAVAARVASLARLKASMPRAERGLLAAPPPFPARPAQGRPGRRFPMALAASLAAGAAGLALVHHGQSPAVAPARHVALAEARQWLTGPAPQDAAGAITVTASGGEQRRLPDLSPAGLRLAWLQGGTAADMIAGYVGPHGCRLGLWIRRTAAGPYGAAADGLQVSTWAAQREQYVLLSRGMDPDRFRRYASAIAALTRHEGAPQDSLRIALEDAATAGRPCEG